MIFSNRKLKIVVIVVLIITILQLIRLGFIVKWDELSHPEVYKYNLELSEKLSEDDLINYNKNKYLYINSSAEDINENYEQLFSYLKMDVDYKDSDTDFYTEDIYSYDLIIIAETEWRKVISFEGVMDYVENGGKAILLMEAGTTVDDMYGYYGRSLGILENGIYSSIEGFELNSPLIEGLEKVESKDLVDDLFIWSVPVQLIQDVDIHMVDENDSPMIWDIDYGEGTLGIFNCYPSNYELRKALTLGLITEVMDYFYYPVINAEVLFIDNFPGQFEGNNEVVEKEYGRNIERYLSEIWWPDIVTTIVRHDIIYTAAFITSYNDNVEGDFEEENLISEKDLLRYGREIFKYGGEISFHGYNHQSLIFDQDTADILGYNAWSSLENIKDALIISKNYFKSVFPNYQLRTYIPPSNLFDDRSKEVISEVFKNIDVYSGVLVGDGDDVLVQKFDVSSNGIINLPRVSSGSIVNQNKMITIMSVASVNGIVNHFIQPDDFMDIDRGQGLSWEKIFESYEGFLIEVEENYPWLEKLTAYDAGQKVAQYHNLELYFKQEGHILSIACDNFYFNQSVIFTTDKELKVIDGGTIEKISDNKYMILMTSNIITLEVK